MTRFFISNESYSVIILTHARICSLIKLPHKFSQKSATLREIRFNPCPNKISLLSQTT
ncbi:MULTISPECIES: hypothetical protein [Flavobacterium]|uniref:hypothetical protein n=1 Tax=Flavobacterium TaxID=237 RepID=UPI00257FC698|nr:MULTISPECIES: hypothetical protein [Flavobacterium]